MPNHCSQRLTIKGNPALIEELKKLVITENSNFDHNTFFPMPEELRGTPSPTVIQTQDEIEALWTEYNKKKEAGELNEWQLREGKPFNLGITKERSNELIQKYGFNNWYDWAKHNWGTKWGIYDPTSWDNCDGNTIDFLSAWSPANNLICKLSEKFPDLSFTLEAADEGGGFVCRYIICDGTESEEEFEWDSPEGIEIRKTLGYYHEDDEEEAED